jgi:deferrochelatase/peroxidase EfeB
MHRLQPGIHFESNAVPRPSYRLLLINARRGAGAAEVAQGLRRLVEMLDGLRHGRRPESAGQQTSARKAGVDQFESLDVLLGYGRRLFDHRAHRPALTKAQRPDFLSYLPGDGPFPALRWARGRRNAEADFAIQLTASTEAAVTCAAVEAWTLIAAQRLPLVIAESFDGFGRADGRGWLGFHDGVSNMPSDQRLRALTAAADPGWMEDGTYMTYLRLPVDLSVWGSLSRAEQELLVGRDKVTGAAVVRVRRADGELKPIAARPPSANATAAELARWRDPPQTGDHVLEAAHVARANQTRASPFAPGALRIFRQGYDFLEAIDKDTVRVGLNFVSFQRDLRVIQQLLHLPEWLGDANFGGTNSAIGAPLISVSAGGLYAVPPNEKPFPGAKILASA